MDVRQLEYFVAVASVVERTLAAFHHRHPGVEIAIRDAGSHLMAEQVRAGELDVAVVGLFADQVPSDLVHTVLAVEPLVAVVDLDHPLTGRAAVDLGELALGGAFVEMRPESGLRRQVDAAFDRAGVTRRIAFELSTSAAVVRYVGLGFGAALVPRSAAESASTVHAIALDDAAAQHPVGLIHRPHPAAPSAQEFVRLLTTT
jgi:DNA-binding transcriptional LysR family regulator